jgi:hypothetical protein
MPITCTTEDKKGEEKTFTKFIERSYWFAERRNENAKYNFLKMTNYAS